MNMMDFKLLLDKYNGQQADDIYKKQLEDAKNVTRQPASPMIIGEPQGESPPYTPAGTGLYPKRDVSLPDEQVAPLMDIHRQTMRDKAAAGGTFTNADLVPYEIAGNRSPVEKPQPQLDSGKLSKAVMRDFQLGKLSIGAAQHLLKTADEMSQIEYRNKPKEEPEVLRILQALYGDVTPENFGKYKSAGDKPKDPRYEQVYDKEGNAYRWNKDSNAVEAIGGIGKPGKESERLIKEALGLSSKEQPAGDRRAQIEAERRRRGLTS